MQQAPEDDEALSCYFPYLLVVLGHAKFKKNLNFLCQKIQGREEVEDPEYLVFW